MIQLGSNMLRNEEIRYLNNLSEKQVIEKADSHLKVFGDAAQIDQFLAQMMFEELTSDVAKSFIFPYGPVGQYTILVDMLHRQKKPITAKHIYFMDEYTDKDGNNLPPDHPLSFKGRAMRYFNKIDSSILLDPSIIVFPSKENYLDIVSMIEKDGGVDVCFGGIGIHGHLAFNEPAEGVRNTDPRLVELNKYTITINAIRESTGGNLYNFPNKANTLGMNQVMSSAKIILSCRNGLKEIDWANTVLRIALFGKSGDDFPVTYLREHEDYVILTDEETLMSPINRL